MPELRKDYATDTWVIFAPLRARRPTAGPPTRKSTPAESCPFCEGHEDRTPPETFAVRDGGRLDGPGWRVRCFPNMFPALEPDGILEESSVPLFARASGVGKHEVIVEAPEHWGHLGLMSEDQVQKILLAYRHRYRALLADERFRYVLVFKNHGERAGATISHPHSQLIALPIVPLRIVEESHGLRQARSPEAGACVFCRIADAEAREGARVILGNESFLAISPYAARFPFETWILPKAHASTFAAIEDSMLSGLARILRDVLGRLYHLLDDPDLNYYIHSAPREAPGDSYHWHIEITPRLSELAGFEQGTGMFVNPVLPEDAAALLRGDVRIDSDDPR